MPLQWEWHQHEGVPCDQVHHTSCGAPTRIIEFDCAPVSEGGNSCVHLVDTEARGDTSTPPEPQRQDHPGTPHAHGRRTPCAYEENDRQMKARGLHPMPSRKPKPPHTGPCGPEAYADGGAQRPA